MTTASIITGTTEEAIAAASRLLRAGALVAFPTETVYGLGADATNGAAVAAIFEAKGRPTFNPLITHVADMAAARRIGVFSAIAEQLAAAYWPGPLTMVLRRADGCTVSELATAGLDTIAVRIPSHPVARALLQAVDRPIVAPSANRSGHVSASEAAHVAADLGGRVALILDGGRTEHGLESTVLDLSVEPVLLLRPGALTGAAIATEIGYAPPLPGPEPTAPKAPGRLESHYATRALIRLNVRSPAPDEALLAFGSALPAHDGPLLNLSLVGNLQEAAANLFSALRQLDASGTPTIAVMPIPEWGLGEAINDRLRRAAAPR